MVCSPFYQNYRTICGSGFLSLPPPLLSMTTVQLTIDRQVVDVIYDPLPFLLVYMRHTYLTLQSVLFVEHAGLFNRDELTGI